MNCFPSGLRGIKISKERKRSLKGAEDLPMKTARLYLVEGRVQGVGFRFFVERAAQSLGLQGYVRNLPDGRVEVYAVGAEDLLEQLRVQLEAGPRASRVQRVEEQAAPVKDYNSFSIGW